MRKKTLSAHCFWSRFSPPPYTGYKKHIENTIWRGGRNKLAIENFISNLDKCVSGEIRLSSSWKLLIACDPQLSILVPGLPLPLTAMLVQWITQNQSYKDVPYHPWAGDRLQNKQCSWGFYSVNKKMWYKQLSFVEGFTVCQALSKVYALYDLIWFFTSFCSIISINA